MDLPPLQLVFSILNAPSVQALGMGHYTVSISGNVPTHCALSHSPVPNSGSNPCNAQ